MSAKRSDSPEPFVTRATLLGRLRDTDDTEAWGRFVEIYTPLVHRYLRSKGLQEADACDVAQEVMRAVARTMPTYVYDPAKGKFRHWLLTVTRRKQVDFLRGQARRPEPAGETAMARVLEESHDVEEEAWETDYHRRLFEWAVGELRPKVSETTWLAFWQTAVEERDPAEVGRELGLGLGSVYVAKSRTIARLRELILAVDEDGDGMEGFPRTVVGPNAARPPSGRATGDPALGTPPGDG